MVVNNSKMADGRHFDNRYIAISKQKNHPLSMKFCTQQQILNWMNVTHSLTAALDQLRVVASSTSNDPGPRSKQHQQIGQCLLPLAAANFSVDDPAGASSQQRE